MAKNYEQRHIGLAIFIDVTEAHRRRQTLGGITTLAAAAALAVGACSSSTFKPTSSAPTSSTEAAAPTTAAATTPVPTLPLATVPPGTEIVQASSQCRARIEMGYALPDPACTPGAPDPGVTQANIGQTICATGWTRTVRPPVSYTEPLKQAQMAEYGDTQPIWTYEEDHLIPLELGGAPRDPHNLWPEPGRSPNPKDDVESAANRAVCDGQMSLASAQRQIPADWVALGRKLGIITSAGSG